MKLASSPLTVFGLAFYFKVNGNFKKPFYLNVFYTEEDLWGAGENTFSLLPFPTINPICLVIYDTYRRNK